VNLKGGLSPDSDPNSSFVLGSGSWRERVKKDGEQMIRRERINFKC